MRQIPLRDQSGHVKANTVVDDVDYERFGGLRWYLKPTGYVVRNGSNGTRKNRWTVMLHREILGLERGDSRTADHVNRDKLDNRRVNLRVATLAENVQNVPSRGGSSRFRGVAWHRGNMRWTAHARLQGERIHLGSFTDELDAALAAESWRRQHMPFALPDPELSLVGGLA